MERIPERQRLEAPRRRPRDLHGHLDGVRAAGREQHLGRPERREVRQLARQRDGRLAGVAARRERQRVHLLGDGPLQARMAVADVMHVVAVEIHVPPAGRILDEDALGLGDRIEARRRHRLAQEIALVLGQHRAGGAIERPPLPRRTPAGEVGVALGLGDSIVIIVIALALPLPILTSKWGEGRGEGQRRLQQQAAAPHPDPLPTKCGEREPGTSPTACARPAACRTPACPAPGGPPSPPAPSARSASPWPPRRRWRRPRPCARPRSRPACWRRRR